MSNKIKIKSIKKLPHVKQWVFDVSMRSNPHTFVGNDILVHNSCYFRVTEAESPEEAVAISKKVHDVIDNNSIPAIIDNIFNGLPGIMKADFEAMTKSTLSFGKKKQYAYIKTWEDGSYLSKNKLAVTGLSIKRTDSPKMLSDKMKPFFIDLMSGLEHKDIKEKMDTIENDYKALDAISLSAKRTANNLNKYKRALDFEIRTGDKPFNIEKLDEAVEEHWGKKIKISQYIYLKFMKIGYGTYTVDEQNNLIENQEGELNLKVDRKMVIPFHIKASLLYNALLKEHNLEHIYSSIANGEKIKLFYIEPVKIPMKLYEDNEEHMLVVEFDCIAFPGGVKDLPAFITEEFKINTKKMLETFFAKKMESFFKVIDYDPDLVQNQSMDLLF